MTLFGLVETWDSLFYSMLNGIEYTRYLIAYPSFGKHLKANKEFKNKHQGNRCFIVLNGPSVNKHDLTPLADEYVFATNYFFRAPLCQIVKPNYYCWLDSKALVDERAVPLVNEIRESCPGTQIFLNAKGVKKLGEAEDLHYVYTKHLANKYGVKCNLSGFCSSFLTVAFMAVISALYMGFDEIYILGLDFEPNGFTHFTNLGKNTDCIKPGEESTKEKVAGHYWGYTLAQYQSYYLEKLARKMGKRIVNLNPNSYVRAFEFAHFEDIIKNQRG